MALITWGPQLSTGLSAIDAEHQKLVKFLNDLHDAMKAGKGKEAVGKIVDELVRYAATHFAHEESWMAKAGYEDLPRHKEIHEGVTKKVLQFQQKSREGTLNAIDLCNFLSEWLSKHIKETDMKYVPTLRDKGM
jgi:hemerythrin